MKKMIFTVFSILLSTLYGFPNEIFADQHGPQSSYIIELENGRKIFLMLSTHDSYGGYSSDFSSFDEYLGTIDPIYSEKLTQSGLYDVYDNMNCIYVVPWYIYENRLVLSSDGTKFAFFNWPQSGQNEVISFYDNGQKYKTHDVSDLMDNLGYRMPTASHDWWEVDNKRSFDKSTGVLSVTTRDYLTHQFDINTGNIISTAKVCVDGCVHQTSPPVEPPTEPSTEPLFTESQRELEYCEQLGYCIEPRVHIRMQCCIWRVDTETEYVTSPPTKLPAEPPTVRMQCCNRRVEFSREMTETEYITPPTTEYITPFEIGDNGLSMFSLWAILGILQTILGILRTILGILLFLGFVIYCTRKIPPAQ
jgi:hypothetical protein